MLMIASLLFSTIFCACVIELLQRMAPSMGLVDRPTLRKIHDGDVPVVGGIAIFFTLAITTLVFGTSTTFPPTLLIISGLLVLLGIADDVLNLSAIIRLISQIVLASVLVFWGDVRIESVGAVFGGAAIEMTGMASAVFTILCVVGVINAINMIDGLDGLAGSILLVSFGALTVLALGSQHALPLGCTTAGIAAFLWYNNRWIRPQARVFLGDSGSMFLGLVLVWYFVELSQGDSPVLHPVSAGWIFGLPLIETVTVMVSRTLDKKSPFTSGRDHLHHKLLSAGLSTNSTVLCMVLIHGIFALVGAIYAHQVSSETILFWSFVAVTIVHFAVCRNWSSLTQTTVTR